MIGIEVLGRRDVSTSAIALHLAKDPADVVFGVTEMHQLTLVRCFKDRVPHLFAVGQQPETSLALG